VIFFAATLLIKVCKFAMIFAWYGSMLPLPSIRNRKSVEYDPCVVITVVVSLSTQRWIPLSMTVTRGDGDGDSDGDGDATVVVVVVLVVVVVVFEVVVVGEVVVVVVVFDVVAVAEVEVLVVVVFDVVVVVVVVVFKDVAVVVVVEDVLDSVSINSGSLSYSVGLGSTVVVVTFAVVLVPATTTIADDTLDAVVVVESITTTLFGSIIPVNDGDGDAVIVGFGKSTHTQFEFTIVCDMFATTS
jgi:hypothetical protein